MAQKIIADALELGDQIQLWDGPYSTATVYRIDKENGTIHVWRPYIHTGDCVYSGPSVIPYVGLEDFQIQRMSDVILVRSNPDKPK